MMIKKPFLFIALDDLLSRGSATLETVARFNQSEEYRDEYSAKEYSFGYKVNLDYLLIGWRSLKVALDEVQVFGRPVFTDIKMWNGERTMEAVVKTLVDLGADYLNVYALADNQLVKSVKATEGTKTKVFGITVLSHYDQVYCQKHFRRSLEDTVRHFAKVSQDAGCHGIILPGTMLDCVSDINILKAVPGIRPNGYKDARHEQEIEPEAAVKKGADILVCGSPIMKSADQVSALKQILQEMEAGKIICK